MQLSETRPVSEEYKIVRFTNKTDFDFTPDMGARFGGVPYHLPAGKSLLAPKPVAQLLAKHLARQTFIKKAPIRDGSETDGKGSDRALWTEEQVKEVANRFLSEEFEQELPVPQSETERMVQKIQELNKTLAPEVPTEGYKDKAEVIAELEKRGIAHDKRSNKEKLEKLLA